MIPTPPDIPTNDEVALFMDQTGGHFASRLAQAYFAADYDNRRRIVAAFPELWATYRAGLVARQEETT